MINVTALAMPLLLFSGQAVIILFIALALATLPSCFRKPRHFSAIQFLANNAASFLIFLAVASAMWSVNSAETLSNLAMAAALSACCLVGWYGVMQQAKVEKKPLSNLSPAAVAALAIALIYMTADHLTDFSISLWLRELLGFGTENIRQPQDKGTAIFIMLFPVFWRLLSTKARLLITPLALAAFITHPMQAAQLAAVAMIFTALGIVYAPRLIKHAVPMGIFVLLWLSPFIFFYATQYDWSGLPESWMFRVDMWKSATHLIFERPLMGYGFGTSRLVEQTLGMDVAFQLHPHNGFLQLWVELGSLGAFAASIMLLPIKTALNERSYHTNRLLLCTLSGWATFTLVSFGLWQTWWLATLFLTALIYATCYHHERSEK